MLADFSWNIETITTQHKEVFINLQFLQKLSCQKLFWECDRFSRPKTIGLPLGTKPPRANSAQKVLSPILGINRLDFFFQTSSSVVPDILNLV